MLEEVHGDCLPPCRLAPGADVEGLYLLPYGDRDGGLAGACLSQHAQHAAFADPFVDPGVNGSPCPLGVLMLSWEMSTC